MPEVLSGSQPGLTVADIKRRMADLTGANVSNSRFANACLGWIQDILLNIQLQDHRQRRTIVHDAEFSTIAETSIYDVRDIPDNGGFGWDNCFRVISLTIPDWSDAPLEAVRLDQWRSRAPLSSEQSVPTSWIALDDFRVRLWPTPDAVYVGYGDYYQDIPNISEPEDKVDWPRPWDSVLIEGVTWKALQWLEPANGALWMAARSVYKDELRAMTAADRGVPQGARKAIVLRQQRNARVIPARNDIYRRGYR